MREKVSHGKLEEQYHPILTYTSNQVHMYSVILLPIDNTPYSHNNSEKKRKELDNDKDIDENKSISSL